MSLPLSTDDIGVVVGTVSITYPIRCHQDHRVIRRLLAKLMYKFVDDIKIAVEEDTLDKIEVSLRSCLND